ncbi:MAG: PspC domain-containing protein [Firmicutes bacterium]|nr:PspC domain-containing protein [Bacillota bacterium]
METKRLYKSSTDKAIFGVCGGFAEYFGIDSLIIRLVLVLFTLAFGAGLLFYLIAALIMPKRPEDGGMPVQPAQPGSYNATGTTYVNRASYAEPMPQDVSRSAAPMPQEVKAEEPADPVSKAWAKERETQETRGAAAGAPKQEAPKQEMPKQEAPKQEAPRPERPYQAYQQPQRTQSAPRSSGDKTRLLLGVILILIGLFVLVRVFLPRFDTRILFAVCVIVAGAVLILKRD